MCYDDLTVNEKGIEMNDRIKEIREQIIEVAGIVDGKIDGVYVYFHVKEMNTRDRCSVWKVTPSGRFQINVDVPGGGRDKIFRTKLKDGSFDVLGVVDAIKAQVAHTKREREIAATVNMNDAVAEQLRNKYPLKHTYVSAYKGSSSSYVAPSTALGEMYVQINFGSVPPEVAAKIMEFAQSIKG